MKAIRVMAEIPEDRVLTVRLPEDVDPGSAEVLVLVSERVDESGAHTLEELLRSLDAGACGGRTREEIDEQIEAERRAWE